MPTVPLCPEDVERFQRDGYFIARGLFSPQEMEILLDHAKSDPQLVASSYDRKDSTGMATKLALWNDPGELLYGQIAKMPRIVDKMEQCLADEVYLYHVKMTLKEPRVGGAWEWHQDYGYWYHNGCLLPTMASCWIAVDRATKENGCMQVLKGTQAMGRIDHVKTGDQTGADLERVSAAMQRFELVYCEMEPGDALFFHGNLLHRSDANRSPHSRWSLICCYNTRTNDPYKESRHPRYTPLTKVSENSVLDWPAKREIASGR